MKQKNDSTAKYVIYLLIRVINRKDTLKTHKTQNEIKFKCKECYQTFTRKYNLDRHMETHTTQNELEFNCTVCDQWFLRKDALEGHFKTHFANK